MSTRVEPARALQREWWLRVAMVLQSPRAVFEALRDDSDEAAEARQEPVLAVVWLAGIAGVLMTNVASTILDDFEIDGWVMAVWAFVAGGLHGGAVYFVVGAALYVSMQIAGSAGSFRHARHVLAFAAVPLAFSLLVWLVRVAVYGGDTFRAGGADAGTGGSVFEGLEVAFLAWSLGLVGLGVRTLHGWPWPRALVASALPALVPALALAGAYDLV